MRQKIFYQVNGTISGNRGDENNPIEVNENFTDENPILLREKAFCCYKHCMDGCRESHGTEVGAQKEMPGELGDFVNAVRSKFASSGYMIIDEMDSDAD